jgi:DNA polymerase III subunit chi
MRIDFYQLSRDPVAQAVVQIARATLRAGQRLLIVAEDNALLDEIGEALWSQDGTFLANGKAGSGHDERQPILLSNRAECANGARYLALADGRWREAEGVERAFLFFDEQTVAEARALWRELGQREGAERHFWKQEGGRWVEAA